MSLLQGSSLSSLALDLDQLATLVAQRRPATTCVVVVVVVDMVLNASFHCVQFAGLVSLE